MLVELEELSVREAADILDIQVRACQRRLRTARTAFDEQLARCLDLEGGKQDDRTQPTSTPVAGSHAPRGRSGCARSESGRTALAARVTAGAAAVATSVSGARSAVGAGTGMTVAKSVIVVVLAGAIVTAGWVATRCFALAGGPTREPRPLRSLGSPARIASSRQKTRAAARAPNAHDFRASTRTCRPFGAHRRAGIGQAATAANQVEHGQHRTLPRIPDELPAETDALRTAQRALHDGTQCERSSCSMSRTRPIARGRYRRSVSPLEYSPYVKAGWSNRPAPQAEGFERRWPRSALVARVRCACWNP